MKEEGEEVNEARNRFPVFFAAVKIERSFSFLSVDLLF